MHQYHVTCVWQGSTGVGYESYDRAHTATTPPVAGTLAVSGDPAFGGDAARWNPEQLFVLAASSCQLLSFLAVAARARLDVIGYDDDARGEMPDDDLPVRVTRIVLRPRIVVRAGDRYAGRADALAERVRHCCEVAHRECYIANSVTTDIVVEPTVVVVSDD